MLEFDEEILESFAADGVNVPLIKLRDELPTSDIVIGGETFHYDRSYPIKGHSAVLPGYVREQIAAGKRPLLIERPDRFYVYLSA